MNLKIGSIGVSSNYENNYNTHNDGHESKPAIFILAIVQESRKTSAFRYFSS